MSRAELTGYAELAHILDNLPLLVREARRARGLSLRAAAIEAGVDFNTLRRVEVGDDCRLGNAVALVRWLDDARKAVS